MQVRSLGRADPLEMGMATLQHWQLDTAVATGNMATPIFLPGESHGQEPGRLQSIGGLQLIGAQRVRLD